MDPTTPLTCPQCLATPDGGGRETFRYLEQITVFRTVTGAYGRQITVRDMIEVDHATASRQPARLQCRRCLATFDLPPDCTVRIEG